MAHGNPACVTCARVDSIPAICEAVGWLRAASGPTRVAPDRCAILRQPCGDSLDHRLRRFHGDHVPRILDHFKPRRRDPLAHVHVAVQRVPVILAAVGQVMAGSSADASGRPSNARTCARAWVRWTSAPRPWMPRWSSATASGRACITISWCRCGCRPMRRRHGWPRMARRSTPARRGRR
jgi:hypothetical protein